ncbi:TetR/AcrR family transcriptional regulator [Streptomyces armeniacus]|uniref:TetR/AcrR family transcriptional regulator n=1 Tax=Streptomyces armeniacus TaxID=83291 RepID=A0A345XUR4_9ACTN|nr:TetR/AcrR family transcriptional regulator [Streptomyces armeniacus]AXK35380.1 TetR/AcrR family transcriptional regulator [Streptomyces armeniacus]
MTAADTGRGTAAGRDTGTGRDADVRADADDVRPPSARRGRPRNAAADTAIVEAVLRLLEDGASVDALSIERIARTAGVGKATVYRRWTGKNALLLDVMRTLDEPAAIPPGESVRDDLVHLLEQLRRRGLAKRNSVLLRTMISHFQSHPGLWREYHDTVIEVRRKLLYDVLQRGVAGGELRDDIDIEVLEELFTGPMLARAILHEGKDLPEGLAEQIVDGVLQGVGPRAPHP